MTHPRDVIAGNEVAKQSPALTKEIASLSMAEKGP